MLFPEGAVASLRLRFHYFLVFVLLYFLKPVASLLVLVKRFLELTMLNLLESAFSPPLYTLFLQLRYFPPLSPLHSFSQ